jgi:hypothetical protein
MPNATHSPKKRKRGLTPKQQLFLHYYLETLNASKAARLAGVPPVSAGEMGHRWLKKVEIRAEVDKRLREMQMTDAEIIHERELIAKADLGDCWDEDGQLILSPNKLPPTVRRAVKTFIARPSGVRIELHGKNEALSALEKIRGMSRERVELTGEDGKPLIDLETWRKMVKADEEG